MSLSESISAEIRAELGRQNRTDKNKFIASALGVSESYAYKLITGKRSFSFEQFEAVANSLGVDAFALIDSAKSLAR